MVPVSRYLKFNKILEGRIQFHLDNKTPDCTLRLPNGVEHGIEVTIERGTEEFYLATELNKTGVGRGFIGIQDDAEQTEFDDSMIRARKVYSTVQALEATKDGILRCLSKKNHKKYNDVFCLLIQAHLNTLSFEQWGAIQSEISNAANCLPFEEIHIIGEVNNEALGFRIK